MLGLSGPLVPVIAKPMMQKAQGERLRTYYIQNCALTDGVTVIASWNVPQTHRLT